MPYDKGPQDIPIPDAVVHETEGAIWDFLTLASGRLSLETMEALSPALRRLEDAAKALRNAQDPRALK
ncbi:hypothetical protein D9623_33875 (plasmid) [Azospirillum brasilense]|uniref:Uncharacterized protein n=1 Tax=Azospirillum brasilense TaxID=192 RepID=A0A4D8QUR0_AZOBR|nr:MULTISPECIES: hypothetical protein [Azospirillum]MDW7555432.1 hypothetical protein [Azospirillum brasilense]MDW7595160.1 hypothetical protein [Azospirillum brasilense]MDW7630313.1 hypothetical protein [Azospirillum brasilense]MDX5949681.1 hypothetical protein [Azospirillum brasilense]QCO12894.1 hypothetical protein D3868_28205 [Azospirillum brasilense]